MTPISSNQDEVPIRISIIQQFTTHRHDERFGNIILMLREQAARELATKIVGLEKFFSVKFDGGYGTQRADCIVMTGEEYSTLMREQFKKGVQHAQGFMPEWRGM